MESVLEIKDSLYKTVLWIGLAMIVSGGHFFIESQAKFVDAYLAHSSATESEDIYRLTMLVELYAIEERSHHFRDIRAYLLHTEPGDTARCRGTLGAAGQI